MVAMRSWRRPRGSHHMSLPAMRISMPSTMRPAPAPFITALTVGQGSLQTLALAVSPTTALSPQAKDILMAFEDAAAGKELLHESFEGSHLLMLDGEKSSSFSPTEQRFFDADLSELLGLQLLEAEFNKKGNRLFQLTRRGAAVARALIDARGGVAAK